MNRLLYTGITERDAARLYEDWLLGRLPQEGAVLACGPALYLLPACPAADFRPVPGEARAWTALDDPHRTAAALRSFRDWRRLPAGAAVCAAASGLFVFPTEAFPLPEDAAALRFPDILDACGTEKEIADIHGVTAKAVKADCEQGLFGAGAKHTPTGWLVDKAAAARFYGGEPAGDATLHPLLLVFTTAEAGQLWGRGAEDVRSAAAGAGHRAARLGDGERRRAGRTWFITRAAAEKLYGDPRPDQWRAFTESMKVAGL